MSFVVLSCHWLVVENKPCQSSRGMLRREGEGKGEGVKEGGREGEGGRGEVIEEEKEDK